MLLLLLFALVFQGYAQDRPQPSLTPSLTDLSTQAKAAIAKGDLAGAEQTYRAALDRARTEGDRAMEAEFLRGIGETYQRRNQWKESLQYYEQALAIRQERQDGAEAAYMLLGIGYVHVNLREDPQADSYLQQSLQAYAGLNEKARTREVVQYHGQALELLAQLKFRQAKPAEAQQLLTQAATFFDSIHDDANGALIRDDLADVYRSQSDYRTALNFAFEALEIQRRPNLVRYQPRTLESLGTIFMDTEQPEKALEYYQECLDLRLKSNDPTGISQAYNNQGFALERLGRLPEAFQALSKSLEMRRRQTNRANIAQTLINLGNVHAEMGKTGDAAGDFQEALQIANEGKFTRERGLALYGVGNLALREGRVQEAIQQHSQALALRQQSGDRIGAVHSLNRLALAYEARNDLAEAEKLHAAALDEFEKIAAGITDPEQVGRFRQSTEILYPHYARVLLKEGKTEEAFGVAERSRGAGLMRMAAADSRGFIQSLGVADRDAWSAAAADRAQAANRLRDLLQAGTAGEIAAEARTRYVRADNALQQLRDRIYAANPKLFPASAAKPEVPKILAGTAGAPRTLYVEWLMVDDSSALLFAVSQGKVRGFELPAGREQIARLGRQWRTSFAGGTVRGVKAAEPGAKANPALESDTAGQIYATIFGPLAAELEKHSWQRLVLVPDGPLLDLAFAGLLDGRKSRLIESYSITTAISIGGAAAVRARRNVSGGLLAIGDPLEAGDERVVAPDGGRYGSLANARVEAKAVAALFPNSVTLTGREAREEAVKQRLEHYQILHFATHGILSRTDGLQSGLLLASEGSESREDGVLQAWEIADTPIAAELAVLSACDTAEGDERLGEGLMGLAWAFQAAGSPNVVASLWSIDDEATSTLMAEFYRLLRSGMRIDESLRGAMLALKRNTGRASPYYWAGFRIVGAAGTITIPNPE